MGERVSQIAFIVFWLAFEHLHMDWDLTWPWLTLGNAFAEQTGIVQWYELTGALGGSLWVLLVNLLLFRVSVALSQRAVRWRKLAIAATVVLTAPVGISWLIGRNYAPQGQPVEVVVVQPNVDPYSEKYTANP
jgi:apolipoprotein N-acyltransferase